MRGPQRLSSTTVHFKKTICLIAEDGSGTPMLVESESEVTGLLESQTLELGASARGSTKDVFSVSHMNPEQH